MAWRKLGRVFAPPGDHPLMRTHGILPTPHHFGDFVRVYFASCDSDLRGRVFFADLDAGDPTKIVRRVTEPVLDVGERGAFDADGVNPTRILEWNDRIYMYYVGYERLANAPYSLLTGIAVSDDRGESFRRLSADPILAPDDDERFFRTAAFVCEENARWRMWYIGGGEWITENDHTFPIYALKHMTSDDPLSWPARAQTLMEPDRGNGDIGFGRPWVEHRNDRYEMNISVRRTTGYRLVSATSPDGLSWQLGDALVEPGPGEWDAEMVCYGASFESNGRRYLLYNGNRFGRTGFGIAIEES